MLVVLLNLREVVMAFPFVIQNSEYNWNRKKLYVNIARLYGKNEFSDSELMKSKEKIHASLSVAP